MYIGIDVGGTNIRVAAIENLDKIKLTKVERCLNENNYPEDLKRLIDLIYQVSDTKPGDRAIQAISIGLPGELEENASMAKELPALSTWNNEPIKEVLEQEFFTEVLLKNDTLAAALGEAYYGLGKDKDFVFVIWGTGVGGTEIKRIGGQIVALPFEPGYQQVRVGDKIDALEEFVGGRGIRNVYQKPAEELSEEEWKQVEDLMAIGLANVMVMHRSKLLILGGGIASNQSKRVQRIASESAKFIEKRYEAPEVKVSSLGEDTGLYGAFAVIQHDGVMNSRLKNVYA
jgi:glucokinase